MDLPALIVGCSFVETLATTTEFTINPNRNILKGSNGAGNQSIAARVLHECSQNQYSKVIVVWSGVHRLDFPIGKDLHDTFSKDKDGIHLYKFFMPLDDVIWYHSGGFGMSGMSYPCPTILRNWFDKQYVSSTENYLTTLSLQSIIQTQGFLQSIDMPYQMSFIYDIDADYSDRSINRSCGQIVRTNPLNSLVDWTKFVNVAPYEYSLELNQISKDGFHPEPISLANWFKTFMNVAIID